MKLYNLKDHNEQVSFSQAVKQGLGSQQGLFFPLELPEFELTDIDEMLEMDFVSRSSKSFLRLSATKLKRTSCTSALKTLLLFLRP